MTSNDEDGDVENGYFNIESFTKLFLETEKLLFYVTIFFF